MNYQWFIILTVLPLLLHCGAGPDGKSGGDGFRHEAQQIPMEEWVTDEDGVSYSTGDRTDWKKVVTESYGTISIEIAFDDREAHIISGIYNRYGQRLDEKQKRAGIAEHIYFEQEVRPGNYFVQIKAKSGRDKSVYSIRASMEGGSGVGNIPRPE